MLEYTAPQRFTIAIPDDVLDDLDRRLLHARWPDDVANGDWRYGTSRAYLETLVRYWRESYDWRRHETEMNRLPHYKTVIDGIPVHFIHQRGNGPRPVPLILSHGWPWTFWDMHKIIPLLVDPASHGGDAADAFDVVVPSLPGFGFSAPLDKAGIDAVITADLWQVLMTQVLGYSRFAAHGGDWGAYVTAQLGHKHAQDLIGIHMLGGAPLDWSTRPLPQATDYAADEAGWYEHTQQFFANEHGYSAQQSTKPQTLAYGLNDSPLGLCAWLVEKRRSWSDCGGEVERRFSKDELLTSVMLYWLTGTIGSSARYYYEARANPWTPSHPGPRMVEAPTGVLKLEHDVCHWPRAAMERGFNLQRWTRSPTGGHFAPMEEPELVVAELREFFRPLRAI